MNSKNIMATLSALVAVAAAAPVFASDIEASSVTEISCAPARGGSASLTFEKASGAIQLSAEGKTSNFQLKELSQLPEGEVMVLGYSKDLGYIEVLVSNTSASTIEALGTSYYAKCQAK